MWDHISIILNKMAAQGKIDKEKLEMFNLPIYEPCSEEVVEAVSAEGSFEIVHLELFMTMPGSSSQSKNKAAFAARALCAPHEDVMARHFGGGVVSDFVKTAEEHIDSLADHDNFKVALVEVGCHTIKRRYSLRFTIINMNVKNAKMTYIVKRRKY
uniref:Uncharacterized protein n=1 Tax=Oryza nivara TaxID=4536 RepID=A0A0E0IHT4_ORYNI